MFDLEFLLLICALFEGSEKVYVLYICENVDNFEWPLVACLWVVDVLLVVNVFKSWLED